MADGRWPSAAGTSSGQIRLTRHDLEAPPAHAAVFCVDEKTAIQALDRKDRMLPLSPGRATCARSGATTGCRKAKEHLQADAPACVKELCAEAHSFHICSVTSSADPVPSTRISISPISL